MNKKQIEIAAKEERLRYFREWRKNNPDKVKQHNRNYWEKKALQKMEEECENANEGTDHVEHKGNR